MIVSEICDCGHGIDDVEHFLLQCIHYKEQRQILKQDIMNVWEECERRGNLDLSVQLLLFPFANDQLTNRESHEIQSATFRYIKNSKRQL